MKIEIDVEEFAAQLKAGKGIGGKDGALTPLIKQLTEMALQAELETHLSQDLERNRKNGTSSKTMKSANGPFKLDTPRVCSGQVFL
jgi:transposase-like protein